MIASIIAILTPLAPKRRLSDDEILSFEEPARPKSGRLQSLLCAFKKRTVLLWSIWWALASCGTYQVANYAQTLWGPMQHDGQFIGNGFVECSNTLLCMFWGETTLIN